MTDRPTDGQTGSQGSFTYNNRKKAFTLDWGSGLDKHDKTGQAVFRAALDD